MTPIAITMLVVTIVIIWGGCAAAVIALRRRPELEASEYPAGGVDADRDEDAIVQRDT